MQRIEPPLPAPTETRSRPLATVLLGIGATLLALLVELQLLRATDPSLDPHTTAKRSETAMSVGRGGGALVDARQPSLQVRARPIDTDRRAAPVDTGTNPFD